MRQPLVVGKARGKRDRADPRSRTSTLVMIAALALFAANSSRAWCRRQARHRPKQAGGSRAARRRSSRSERSTPYRLHSASRLQGDPGCLRRASASVSTTRSQRSSGRPIRSSSALRKAKSNAALCMTSMAPLMKRAYRRRAHGSAAWSKETRWKAHGPRRPSAACRGQD